ncbi:hypothetical protein SAY87_008914 [Trapa incisa]|uniref:K Homology domain-containing protein n=1 Tax=Trapa incisa TaxID=236973 RepID=A0AAN7JXW3_9MYRT|nr:hypothetical protein SAY87_008914 [Trapa incisa]
MERSKRDLFRKRSGSFKKKGSNHKKGRSTGHEWPSGISESPDTVYRILCPSNKIGGVIGKGGGVIKALRDETRAKITVSDSVPGSDERVIIIYSSPTKISKESDCDEEGLDADNEEDGGMEPHCPAQDALLKVHDRILEEDLFGGMTFDDDNDGSDVTIRLLVPNNMVGCILGRKGDVIQQLRKDTGAGIRVLPSQNLPTCAMSTDELVQITGKPDVVKRALYEVSTRLHQNPRKDQPPLNISMLRSGQGFHQSEGPTPSVPTLRSPMLGRNTDPYSMPPAPWTGEHGNRHSGPARGSYDDVSSGSIGESSEFSLKILCSSSKIRAVIGKGGCNVKHLEQETGASIHVEDSSRSQDDERVIRVSAVEAIWNPRSQTIDAILQLLNQTGELSEEGSVTTRLLVPSSKVGCILGQGGHVINEMRRRTRADIRVISKDDKPSCASEEEELVQISGNMAVARDALAEILSRLRVRTLRDTNTGGRHPLGLAALGRPSGPISVGVSGGFEHYKDGQHEYEPLGHPGPRAPSGFFRPSSSGVKGGDVHEYEPRNYPDPRALAGYAEVNNSNLRFSNPNSAIRSALGMGRSNSSNIGEIAGERMKHQDHHTNGSEPFFESRGPTTQRAYDQYMTLAVAGTSSQQIPPYHPTSASQDTYKNINEHVYSIRKIQQQSPYPSRQGMHSDANAASYNQNISAQQGTYQY